MERPAPILIPITNELNESNLFKFELQYKSDNIDFSLIDINNSKIKLIANSQIKKGIFKNYSIELTLDYLKKQNKYFKMFDNYQEFRNNFIDICKAKNIKVINIENGELVIAIDLLIISENLLYLSLKENELSQKEQIELLIRDSNDKDKKISELNDKIQIMEKNYSNKISSLEKNINELIKRIEILEKERDVKKKSLDKKSLDKYNNYKKDINKKIIKEADNKNIDLFGSKILLNQKEFEFLSNTISDKKVSLELLYSSLIKGENEDELIKAYIGKNDLLFLIKTSTNKRFGGYSHETFELNKFHKIDEKAFLFNIDNLEIYKSKGTEYSLNKKNATMDSINFGGGTDLRIFHNFFSEKNYTSPKDNKFYDYKKKKYALNGEKYFEISIFELYRVIIQ
jgi:hypothetical protein